MPWAGRICRERRAGAESRAPPLRDVAKDRQPHPDIWILPCHTSEPIPFDGKACGARLGEVLRNVEMLSAGAESFVETLLSRIPETPPNHLEIVRLNERGELPEGDPTELEAGANRCAIS